MRTQNIQNRDFAKMLIANQESRMHHDLKTAKSERCDKNKRQVFGAKTMTTAGERDALPEAAGPCMPNG
jgi:hypothetical protein